MKLNEQAVKKAELPKSGYSLIRDDELTGFAVRVTSKGSKSFVLHYTVSRPEQH
jgi:hypothetical protein